MEVGRKERSKENGAGGGHNCGSEAVVQCWLLLSFAKASFFTEALSPTV